MSVRRRFDQGLTSEAQISTTWTRGFRGWRRHARTRGGMRGGLDERVGLEVGNAFSGGSARRELELRRECRDAPVFVHVVFFVESEERHVLGLRFVSELRGRTRCRCPRGSGSSWPPRDTRRRRGEFGGIRRGACSALVVASWRRLRVSSRMPRQSTSDDTTDKKRSSVSDIFRQSRRLRAESSQRLDERSPPRARPPSRARARIPRRVPAARSSPRSPPTSSPPRRVP